MRILAITNLYPRPGHERMAAFNRQQFRALAERHELRVIAPVPWQEVLKDRLTGRATPSHYINGDGIHVDHPIFYYLPRVRSHRWGEYYLRSIRPIVERRIEQFRPDVMLACWAHPDGWATVKLARQAGLPVVVKVIGSDVLVLTRQPRRLEPISRTLQQASAVVAVSRDLAQHAERLGAEPFRVHVVPEGTNRELFAPGSKAEARQRLNLTPDRPIILFVGNLLESKGAALLIEACRLLRNEGTQGFQCYLIGSGRDAGKLRRLIARYTLSDCVSLPGPCAQTCLPDWYRASDVVALPSFSEGIPNVLREALECGRPFVATRVGGIPEISHPSYSRLVERGDVRALAVALAENLESPTAVDPTLVRLCNLSCQESAARFADVLATAVAERRPNPAPSPRSRA
ncbi:MAG TPA: glycosyltransferase [Pirellulales bacterium]|nr:glycosyltransferase [Pirellulales bacterium]